MKRYGLMLAAVAALALVGGCERGPRDYMPMGMWSLVDDYGNTTGMTLTFNGETVAVQYAPDSWPTDNGVWDYYINQEGEMKITYEYEEYDSDYGWRTTSETVTFDWSLNDDGSMMTLAYRPPFGHTHRFYFKRI